MDKIINQLTDRGIEYSQNVSMKTKTWIHRGPTVALYITPKNSYELESVIKLLHDFRASYKVIGHTSNIYMLDSYKIDAIVSTTKLTSYTFKDDTLTCEAGVNISRLSQECVEKGYKGFEGLVGLPGTVGAAIVNNASCFKCAPSQMLLSATILEEEGDKVINQKVEKKYFDFSHRSSAIKRHEKPSVILDVTFQLTKTDDMDALRTQAQYNIKKRKDTQEGKAKNLGSIYAEHKERQIRIFSLGFLKFPLVIGLRVMDHFFRDKYSYNLKRNRYLIFLYGYYDILPYVSPKNLNCFVWKDDGADKAFLRYEEFMHKCFICGNLEIEICK